MDDGVRLTFFALDGSYGDANGMIVVDTRNWTENDWDSIIAETDARRALTALRIENRLKKGSR